MSLENIAAILAVKDFQAADLRSADLRGADLRGANLRDADLWSADLRSANLWSADLRGADLRGANLWSADLRGADLRGANLRDAGLWSADLRGADLSDATGLLNSFTWLGENFEKAENGWVVYKAFGNTHYPQPWVPEPGKVLTEVVNLLPTCDCACGVNVATLEWLRRGNYTDIWKCLIPFERSCGIVVPYNTDGKFRTDYLVCLEKV